MTATWVLACALSVLGRSADSMPPIELLEVPPIDASPRVEAFVRLPERKIYLITSSPAFLEAMRLNPPCSQRREIHKIASILVHEEWHILHGSDEKGAYQEQLRRLISFGVPPDNAMYLGVVRSMMAALKKPRSRPDTVLAKTPAPAAGAQAGISSALQ